MRMDSPACVTLLLLLLCSQSSLGSKVKVEEIQSSEEFAGQEGGADFLEAGPDGESGRVRRAVPNEAASADSKCSYTFIVPQKKVTGAICVSSKEPEGGAGGLRVHKRELEVLNGELQKQKRQIETLQTLVEVDGGVVNEVKLLRKESRNMNARVTQLYMQLLHEIIRKRDTALELSQLENRILNQTAAMLTLTTRYRDLEHQYQHLASLANNQSALIARMEEQCGGTGQRHPVVPPRQQPQPQPRAPPPPPPQPQAPPIKPYKPPTYRKEQITNEIQSDQNPKVPPPLPTMPSGTHTNSTTDMPSGPFKDCLHALEEGHSGSGMRLVQPEASGRLMQVWCDQRQDPGGWTLIQRRQDGSVNFFRNWETYKQGFGNIDGEYWLGLENIYSLTNQGNYKLLVTLEDWAGRKVFAEYASFRLEDESDFYRLRVGRYHGNAGDSLTWHNGKQFTTLDRDHDVYTGNCAHYQKGGWWYNSCAHSNLNGVWYRGGHYRSRYQDGVYWAEFRGGAYSLKKVVMMIRPNPDAFH
ncbi:angiopoietin-related protein 2-like [Engraulis encrasicolus]|uniref:angiopoietin-related protein 2-like n=1 Tax=Engraulis encrasicolus TaxID=184585 RepID=UPI002FD296DF